MALGPNELTSSVDQTAYPRIYPYEGGVRSKKLASSVGAEKLEVGTPLAFDTVTQNWKVWAFGALNGGDKVKAVVYPDPIQLDAANEVLGNVLTRGEIHAEDVLLPAGQLQANLDAALRDPDLHDRGIDVQGLADVV